MFRIKPAKNQDGVVSVADVGISQSQTLPMLLVTNIIIIISVYFASGEQQYISN